MIDFPDWGLFTGIIVGWTSLLILLLAFVASASGARRGAGLRVARALADERARMDLEARDRMDERDRMDPEEHPHSARRRLRSLAAPSRR
jgi:hypothetical protein